MFVDSIKYHIYKYVLCGWLCAKFELNDNRALSRQRHAAEHNRTLAAHRPQSDGRATRSVLRYLVHVRRYSVVLELMCCQDIHRLPPNIRENGAHNPALTTLKQQTSAGQWHQLSPSCNEQIRQRHVTATGERDWLTELPTNSEGSRHFEVGRHAFIRKRLSTFVQNCRLNDQVKLNETKMCAQLSRLLFASA